MSKEASTPAWSRVPEIASVRAALLRDDPNYRCPRPEALGLLLARLGWDANRGGGQLTVGVEQLSARTGLHERTVRRGLEFFERIGWVKTVSRGNQYTGSTVRELTFVTTEEHRTVSGPEHSPDAPDRQRSSAQQSAPDHLVQAPDQAWSKHRTASGPPNKGTREQGGGKRGQLVARGEPGELDEKLTPLRSKYGTDIVDEGMSQLAAKGNRYGYPRELIVDLEPLCGTIASRRAAQRTRERHADPEDLGTPEERRAARQAAIAEAGLRSGGEA